MIIGQQGEASSTAMPLFRLLGACGGPEPERVAKRKQRTGRCRKTDEDVSVPSLAQLCLLSLADNMKDVWVKDYADNYLDQYSFRYIMGPFNLLRECLSFNSRSGVIVNSNSECVINESSHILLFSGRQHNHVSHTRFTLSAK